MIFGIGFSELFLIALIVILIIDPQDLPTVIKDLILMKKKIQNQTNTIKNNFNEIWYNLEKIDDNTKKKNTKKDNE